MTKMVEISEKVYLELLDDQNMLAALQAAGVDNWDGYDYALEIYEEMSQE